MGAEFTLYTSFDFCKRFKDMRAVSEIKPVIATQEFF